MKTIKIIVGITFLLINNSYSQITRSILDKDLIYGKVKEIDEVHYLDPLKGPLKVDTVRKDILLFDEQGNMTRHEAYSPPNTKAPVHYVENFTTLIDSAGIKTVMCRDSLNFVENYNKGGYATDRYYFNKNGKSLYKVIYSYDERNNLIKELHYQNNNLSSTSKHKYDKHNRLTETEILWSHADPQLINYSYEKFDKNLNWIKRFESFETVRGHIFKGPIVERTIIYY